jgi:enoyl-[acyl-carrier-protein] reductase (NADH)
MSRSTETAVTKSLPSSAITSERQPISPAQSNGATAASSPASRPDRVHAFGYGRETYVHSLSAGPVKIHAGSGIDRFDEMLDRARDRTPSHQLVGIEEIGRVVAF